MSEIAKAYEPKEVEQRWYANWLEAGCFKAVADSSKEPYAIMIPPPNVTGMLHMGHVLDNTLQDIFVRRARLEGKAVLWQPGTDHAGIATQTKVEKQLREVHGTNKIRPRSRGLPRKGLGLPRRVRRRDSQSAAESSARPATGIALALRSTRTTPKQCWRPSSLSISAATSTAASAWSTGARRPTPRFPTKR